MDVIKLLQYLQEIIETSSKVPITGKILVDKKEMLDIIDQIINTLPDELKKAQWVVEEKERILGEVIKESETIKKESIDILKRQIENHDISKDAKVRAEEIISSAQRDAKTMRLGARDYADEILSQLEKEIESKGHEMVLSVKDEVEKFVLSLNSQVVDATDTIRNNVKELRGIK